MARSFLSRNSNSRPEGPIGNSPGREPGVVAKTDVSPEGPTQSILRIGFIVSPLRGFLISYPYPGLTPSPLPTGETGDRPDRKVGITQLSEMSAEGAALQGMFTPSVAPSALISILILLSRPYGRAY
jgi:hypothetical protein